MKRDPGDGATDRHLALQEKAEAAKAEIEMVVGVSAKADPNLNATSVVLFVDLAEPQTRKFLAACDVTVGPDIETFVGLVQRYLARLAVSDRSLKQWLARPVAPGFVPLLAIAGDGAGHLVVSNTDVRIPEPDLYSVDFVDPAGSA